MNRNWERRFIVWTREKLFIARGEILVDTIPLHEIVNVSEMNEDNVFSSSRASKITMSSQTLLPCESFENEKSDLRQSLEIKSRKPSARQLQLKTVANGFNGGRTYYIRTLCNSSSDNFLEELTQAIRIAQKHVNRQSWSIKCQETVRRLQESTPFQSCIVFFIITVIPDFVLLCCPLALALLNSFVLHGQHHFCTKIRPRHNLCFTFTLF